MLTVYIMCLIFFSGPLFVRCIGSQIHFDMLTLHVQAQAAVTTRAFSGRGGLRTQDIQLARYESKDMVCPVCSRRFLGLTALRAHLAAAHNSSTRHRTQAISMCHTDSHCYP
jgi:hypothetical protein